MEAKEMVTVWSFRVQTELKSTVGLESRVQLLARLLVGLSHHSVLTVSQHNLGSHNTQ